MSAYTTPAAVRLVLDPDFDPDSPEPEIPAQTAADLTDEQINDAIAQAQARVDSYLAARYATPVSTNGLTAAPLIGSLTADIAAYRASLTYFRSQPMDTTEPIYLRYQAAMIDLTAIRDGKSVLPIDPAGGDSPQGGYAGVVDAGNGGLFDAYDVGYRPAGGSLRPWYRGGFDGMYD